MKDILERAGSDEENVEDDNEQKDLKQKLNSSPGIAKGDSFENKDEGQKRTLEVHVGREESRPMKKVLTKKKVNLENQHMLDLLFSFIGVSS